MKKRTALFILILFFGLSPAAKAVETVDALDLEDQIISVLNLDFKQEDVIKPMVKAYAESVNKIAENETVENKNNEKAARSKVLALDEKLGRQIAGVLHGEQFTRWKTEKVHILPYFQQEVWRESAEAGEANESAAMEAGENGR